MADPYADLILPPSVSKRSLVKGAEAGDWLRKAFQDALDTASVPGRAVQGKLAHKPTGKTFTEEDQFLTDLAMDKPREAALSIAGNVVGTPGTPKGALGAGARDPRLWHPISDTKLPRPLDEMQHKTKPRDVPAQPLVDIAKMEGDYLLPSPGDLSRNDVIVQGIGGNKLPKPVEAHGGAYYGSAQPDEIWRSAPGVITGISRVAKPLQEQGKNVNLATITMGPQAIDFSHHVYDPYVQLLKKQGGMEPAIAKQFDEKMRTKGEPVPDWPGINEPALPDYLRSSAGRVASKMAGLADQASVLKTGAPSIAEIRHAFTAPEMLDVPLAHGGFNFGRIAPGENTGPGIGKHATAQYSAGLRGEQLGGFGRAVPPEVLFPDLMEQYSRHWAENGLPANKWRPGYMLERGLKGKPKAQLVTPQLVDQVSQWLERNPLPPR